MKKIEWENPKKKGEAYTHLMKVFKVSRPTVSLAMSFKRNSLEAARMRHVALTQLGAKLLSDEGKTPQIVRILNAKGETVKAVVTKEL
ncbi:MULTISPECIES: hypothetical protein [Bacteroides]|jgi:hypothetical protein|uniref:hypothetical protein n=1 Tax=Bacteroides TaxID=816 RepID=UPI000E52D82D|nr:MULTISPECIES: hypothetical protein [Bacteroides]RHL08897.1 hypothetical protein DW036_13495 [Bacteroides sp. AF39-11AC]DAG95035.1 MAG TPA: LacI-type transcriptional regulator [Herelleviridae sp.]